MSGTTECPLGDPCCDAGPLPRFFRKASTAFITCFAALGLLVGVYFLVHLLSPPRTYRSGDVPTIVLGEHGEPSFSQNLGPWDKVITVEGLFEIRENRASLRKYYAEKSIQEFLDDLYKQADALRAEALTHRRDLLTDMYSGLSRTLGGRQRGDFSDSQRLGELELKGVQPAKRIEPGPGIFSDLSRPANSIELDDNRLRHFDLRQAMKWLEDLSRTAGVCAVPYVHQQLERYGENLERQFEQENDGKRVLMEQIIGMQPPLNFTWLYIEGAGWVVEVVFWSWLGVLVSTIIGTIAACRNCEYSGRAFTRGVWKIMLAPILAFITVSLMASGFTTGGFTSMNLPYFLALSFLLGFSSERLVGLLRDISRTILGGVKLDTAALRRAQGVMDYVFRFKQRRLAEIPVPLRIKEAGEALREGLSGELEEKALEAISRRAPKGAAPVLA